MRQIGSSRFLLVQQIAYAFALRSLLSARNSSSHHHRSKGSSQDCGDLNQNALPRSTRSAVSRVMYRYRTVEAGRSWCVKTPRFGGVDCSSALTHSGRTWRFGLIIGPAWSQWQQRLSLQVFSAERVPGKGSIGCVFRCVPFRCERCAVTPRQPERRLYNDRHAVAHVCSGSVVPVRAIRKRSSTS